MESQSAKTSKGWPRSLPPSPQQKVLATMPDEASKAKLKDAQRAWVAFRDAEIALNGQLPGATGNTLKMLQTELTETRTKQLKALIDPNR
jgi:uncharacterized protein YecT (DUF1311 family)